jgi:hypothetical protein
MRLRRGKKEEEEGRCREEEGEAREMGRHTFG